jgi:hypothetical protein
MVAIALERQQIKLSPQFLAIPCNQVVVSIGSQYLWELKIGETRTLIAKIKRPDFLETIAKRA